MRASTRPSAVGVCLILSAFAACDASHDDRGPDAGHAGTGGIGGQAGGAGSGGAGTAGTGGQAGSPEASTDHQETGGTGGGSLEGGTEAGRGGSAGNDAEAGAGGAKADAEAGAGGSTPDAEAGVGDCNIIGTSPFGSRLSGDATFPLDDGGSIVRSTGVYIYFPAGRVPDAPVVLAHGGTAAPFGGTEARGTLDSLGNVTGLSVHDSCANGIKQGSLSGASWGLAGTAVVNTSPFPSDAIMTVEAPVRLCPSGGVPAATLASTPTTIWSTQRLAIKVTTPIDLATRATIKLKGSNRALTVTGGETQPIVDVTPQSGVFAPGDLTLDISGLKDVLGRSYGDSLALTVQKPATAIIDRTLTTPPPNTAWATNGLVNLAAKNGLLVADPPMFSSQTAFTVGLGEQPGSKTLRIKHRWVCGSPATTEKHVTLVASDGASVEVGANCASAPEDVSVTLVGAAPYFLQVHAGYEQNPPCYLPNPPVRDGWELDEFSFEP